MLKSSLGSLTEVSPESQRQQVTIRLWTGPQEWWVFGVSIIINYPEPWFS